MPALDLTKDYYKILGVSPDVDDSALRKAYYALAKKFHPDKNKAAEAEDAFKEIQAAYNFLLSKDNRAAFDREREQKRQDKDNIGKNASSTSKPTTTPKSGKDGTSSCDTESRSNPNWDKKEEESTKTKSQHFRFNSAHDYHKSTFDFRSSPGKGNGGNKSKPDSKDKVNKESKFKTKTSSFEPNTGYSRNTFSAKNRKIFEDVCEDILRGKSSCSEAHDIFTSLRSGSRAGLPSWELEDSDDDGIDLRFSPPRKPSAKTAQQRRKSQVYGEQSGKDVLNDPELDHDLFDWTRQGQRNCNSFDYDSDDSNYDGSSGKFPCRFCARHFALLDLNHHELNCEGPLKFDWRTKQDTFRRLVREDKLKHKRNKSAPDNPQYGLVQCQFCGLRVNKADASVHIPQCKRVHGHFNTFRPPPKTSRDHVQATYSWSKGSCSPEEEELLSQSADETLFRFMGSSAGRRRFSSQTYADKNPHVPNNGAFSPTPSPRRSSTPNFKKSPKIDLSFKVNTSKKPNPKQSSSRKSPPGGSTKFSE